VKLPLGYRFASVYAGIRKAERDDLGLILSETPASAAAVFTQNRVQAAPVKLARRHLRLSHGVMRAILVNAGNANCATRTGEQAARAVCDALAARLQAPVEQILPASTGVIGVELDAQRIIRALPNLIRKLSADRFMDVAHAIMTTDTVPKTSSREIVIRNRTVRIAGMTKGAGMIQPRMATTLGFVATDAHIEPSVLKQMLHDGIERSYNRISVDGDTSTNDTVAVFANGASGVEPGDGERILFGEALAGVLEDLARQIARDGEGARKLITIDVEGARDDAAAQAIARAIGNSPLVKTAIAGSDANWGRILCAAGNAGVDFDPAKVDIYLQNALVCRGGLAAEFSEPEMKELLDKRECAIRLVVNGSGQGRCRFWTCDLTEDYIRINASYRT
jgi:glutamate N-acetyltransferase/amino-acid N-acetyltransferase